MNIKAFEVKGITWSSNGFTVDENGLGLKNCIVYALTTDFDCFSVGDYTVCSGPSAVVRFGTGWIIDDGLKIPNEPRTKFFKSSRIQERKCW